MNNLKKVFLCLGLIGFILTPLISTENWFNSLDDPNETEETIDTFVNGSPVISATVQHGNAGTAPEIANGHVRTHIEVLTDSLPGVDQIEVYAVIYNSSNSAWVGIKSLFFEGPGGVITEIVPDANITLQPGDYIETFALMSKPTEVGLYTYYIHGLKLISPGNYQLDSENQTALRIE